MSVLARFICVISAFSLASCAVSISESDILLSGASPPLEQSVLEARAPGYEFEPQTVIAPDGVRLSGVFLRRSGATLTILYFGGNTFRVGGHGADVAAQLAATNANIMLVDHRGSGQSQGTPSVATLRGDALAVFDHLASLPGVSPDRILVHGHSLGSFMAGDVAAERATAGVVLESSATTTEAWMKTAVGGLGSVIRFDIPESLRGQGNLVKMSRISEPLLIVVGANDQTTPASLSRALYAAEGPAGAQKQLFVVSGASHNDVLLQAQGMDAYLAFVGSLQ